MYVSFEENPTQLDSQIRALGIDPARKGLRLLYVSPVELQIDSIVSSIFRTIRGSGIRRIAIDAVGDLIEAAQDPRRLHDYLYALSQHFAVHGVTSVFPYETTPAGDVVKRMSALADNLVVLGFELDDGRGRRTLRVAKARGIAHDLDVHDLRITSTGVEVA
jgi:circadian clock protein KaiC